MGALRFNNACVRMDGEVYVWKLNDGFDSKCKSVQNRLEREGVWG